MSFGSLSLSPRTLLGGLAALTLAGGIAAQGWELDVGTGLGCTDETNTAPQALGFSFPLPSGGTTTDVVVNSNGYVVLAGTISSDWSETEGELLSAGGERIAAQWDDLNASGGTFSGGDVYFNTFASPQRAVVTWQMTEYGATEPVTVQLQLFPDGSFRILTADAARDCLVGVSPGNGATDPGSSDLSAGVVGGGTTVYERFSTGNVDIGGVELVFAPNGSGYDVGAAPFTSPVASVTRVGTGCPAAQPEAMIYEYFDGPPAFDLPPSTSILYAWNGSSYTADFVPYAWDTNVGATLGLADLDPASGSSTSLDDNYFNLTPLGFTAPIWGGSVTDIRVATNGTIWFGGTPPTRFPIRSVGSSILDNGPVLSLAAWDLDPSSGGTLHLDITATHALVTYDSVPKYEFPGPSAETLTAQAKIFPSGNVLVSYQSNGITNFGHIGLFAGNMTPDQGSIDFTASLPATAPLTGGLLPLDLDADAAPVLNTSINLIASNVRGSAVATVLHFGLPYGAIPLDFIGMTGCTAYVGNELGLLLMTPGTGDATLALMVPNNTALIGVLLPSQAFCLDPGINALGISASNELDLKVGI